jgi:predicted N-acetyltransferase YhbS
MNEVRILPIFDQSAPGVWDDMLRIRIAAMQHNYNIKLTDQEISEAMAEFQKSWKRLSFNFAFGAYDDGKMVGCINGDVQNKTAFMRHLYVLPEYQGLQIGRWLLSAAERAVSIEARHTSLVSLAGAEKFYQRMGYHSLTGLNNYVKEVSLSKCSCLPVFHASGSFNRACEKLRATYADMPDVVSATRQHLPVFAEYYIDSNLRAMGIINSGTAHTRATTRIGHDMMHHALSYYMTHSK